MKKFPYRYLVLMFIIVPALLLPLWAETPGGEAEVCKTVEDELKDDLSFIQTNQELDRFFSAKENIFKRKWNQARDGLKAYLEDFPAGQMRDEAYYWLAFSLNKLSQGQTKEDRMVELKEQAVENLNRIREQFPGSLWKDDANKMLAEIFTELIILQPQKEYPLSYRQILETQNKSQQEMNLAALGSLIELAPETAIPVLRRIVEADEDPKMRSKAVLLLGRQYSGEVIGILEKAAALDEDESVRKEAVYWLEQIRVRMIPVQLNYFAYAVRLEDQIQQKRIVENKVNHFLLPPCNPSQGAAKKSMSRFFQNRLMDFSSIASSRGFSNSPHVRVGHNLNDFYLSVLGSSLEKRHDRISGKVYVRDKKNGKDYYEDFTVDERNDVLLSARRGDRLFMMLLQFEYTGKAQAQKPVSAADLGEDPIKILERIFGLKEKPVYYTQTNMGNGLTVLSSLKTSDYSQLKNMHDYGLSEAQIPSSTGIWKLTGYLLYQRNEKRFLGRMAVLLNPQSQVKAVADQIYVPLDNPAGFKVVGSRLRGTGQELAIKPPPSDAKRDPFPTVLPEILGWKIRSSRLPISEAEISGDKRIDLSLAAAEKTTEQGTWELTGYLILDKTKRRILAVNGTLIDPDGKTVFSGELISVPLDDPSQAKKIDIKDRIEEALGRNRIADPV